VSGSTAQVVQFVTPLHAGPFQFQAVLDGATYNVVITWNIYRAGGEGYYIGVYGEDGTRVFFRALIASPPDYDISMTAGYFATKIVFRDETEQFTVS
jgi:hypothetical protein